MDELEEDHVHAGSVWPIEPSKTDAVTDHVATEWSNKSDVKGTTIGELKLNADVVIVETDEFNENDVKSEEGDSSESNLRPDWTSVKSSLEKREEIGWDQASSERGKLIWSERRIQI